MTHTREETDLYQLHQLADIISDNLFWPTRIGQLKNKNKTKQKSVFTSLKTTLTVLPVTLNGTVYKM